MADLDLSPDTGAANTDLDGMFEQPDAGETTDNATTEETTDGEIPDEEIPDVEETADEATEETTEEQPEPEPEPEPEEKPEVEKKPEDVPEDVEVRESKGKKYWYYPEEKGRRIFAGFKRAQAAEEVIQEELTPELAQTLRDAATDMEWMRVDFLSGDPTQQAKVFTHFIRQAESAIDRGEVGSDPVLTAAETFVEVLERRHPQAFQALASKFAPNEDNLQRSMLRKAYTQALTSGNENLKRSAQWVAKEMYGDHKWLTEPEAKPDPVSQREQELTRREQAIRQRDEATVQQKWTGWTKDTATAVNDSVTGAIEDVVKPVLKSYEKFPERLKNLRVRFSQEVKEAIQSDPVWKQANEQLYTRARLAVSEEVRNEIRERIARRYASKAKAVVDRLKQKVFSEDAQLMKAENAATRQRQQVAQNRRGTGGPSAPVTPTVPAKPLKGGVGRDDWSREMDRIFS